MEIIIGLAILGFVLGAVMGSFACCQTRRMRRKEKNQKDLGMWSECEHCGHKLAWYENIPVISWLIQKGKCRKCKKKIGKAEILSELGLGLIFAILILVAYRDFQVYGTSEVQILFAIGLVCLLLATATAMWMIVVYDMSWGKMPTVALIGSIICAAIYRGILLFNPAEDGTGIAFVGINQSDLLNLLGAILILPALYFGLYFFSREKLVGSGDWLLALAIALILGDWWLAFFELFAANALASIMAIYLIIRDRSKHKKSRTSRFGKEMSMKIPFGPFLVVGQVIVLALAPMILKLLVLR